MRLWPVAFFFLFLVSNAVAQDSVDEYQRLTETATQAYEQGRFEEAISALEQAYALQPESAVLYNIGRIAEEAGLQEKAVQVYEQFMALSDVDLEYRRDAIERVKLLREIIAMRKADEQAAADAKAKAEADAKAKADAEAQAQAKAEAEAKAKADAETAKLAKAAEPPPEQSRALRNVGIVLAAVGGASMLGGTATGILALGAHDDFDAAEGIDARRDAKDKVDTLAPVTDTLLFGGGALLVAGVTMILVDALRAPEQDPSALAVTPMFSADGLGLGVRLAF